MCSWPSGRLPSVGSTSGAVRGSEMLDYLITGGIAVLLLGYLLYALLRPEKF
jgi:K+-transporting ATPase KdpF subunit